MEEERIEYIGSLVEQELEVGCFYKIAKILSTYGEKIECFVLRVVSYNKSSDTL